MKASCPSRAERLLALVLYRVLVVALSAVAVVAQVGRLDRLYLHALGFGATAIAQPPTSFLGVVVMEGVLSLAAAGLALALVFRPARARDAHVGALVLAVWAYLFAYAGVVVLLRPEPGSLAAFFFEGHFLFVEIVGLAAMLRFTAVFPRALTPDDLEPPERLPAILRPFQRARAWLLSPWAPWLAGALTLLVAVVFNAALGRPVQDAPLLPLVEVLPFLTLAFVVANFRRSHALGDTQERHRLEWLAAGFATLLESLALVVGGNVLLTVTGWTVPGVNWRSVVLHAGVLGLIVGVGTGIRASGVRSPGPLARTGVLAAGVLFASLLLGAGLEALLTGGLTAGLSLPEGWGTALALLSGAVAYVRLRGPLERALTTRPGPAVELTGTAR